MKRIKKCLAYLMVLIIGFNLFFYVSAKNVYPKIKDDYNIKASSGENVLKNDYLEVVVNKDGKFTIGTIEGNPEILTDNNKKLLFGHPDPRTSQTTIKIDEDVKILDENQNASFNLNGDSLEVIYNIDKIQVKQVLSIVENTSTARKDVVEIKYEVKNTDTISHNIGTRIMLDTMLGDNDEAPFRIPGVGNVDREMEFSGDNIPEYWQAFDNLKNPSVVSQGSFLRNIENKPDKVQFIHWNRVKSNPWNVKIHEGSLIGDSAVTVTWNEKELLAGETRNYVTYYGMSELVQDLTPPLSLSIYGDTVAKLTNDKCSYNDIVVSAYIKNIGNGLSSETYAEIILPKDISLVNGEKKISLNEIQVGEEKQVSWKLKIKPSLIEKTLTYSIKVYSDNAQEKMVSTNILVPSTKAGSLNIKYQTVLNEETEAEYEFYYSDDFFKESSYKYNHELAKMSLGMAVAAFSSQSSLKYYGEDAILDKECLREKNIIDAYSKIGFDDLKTFKYDKSLNDSSDTVAFSIAKKYINTNECEDTLVAVVLRGGGYGAEWASNFQVANDGRYHEGFNEAAVQVTNEISKYIAELTRDNKVKGKIKIWLTGYSRSAAVANITAGKLDKLYGNNKKVDTSNIYVYTFATPQGVVLTKDEKENNLYRNIFNIVNPQDLVPTLALKKWNFGRYGLTLYLPTNTFKTITDKNIINFVNDKYSNITKGYKYNYNSSQDKLVEETNKLIYKLAKTTTIYERDLQKPVKALLKLLNSQIKKDGVWTSGEDIVEKFFAAYGREGAIKFYEVSSKYSELPNWMIVLISIYEIDFPNVNVPATLMAEVTKVISNLELLNSMLLGTKYIEQNHYPELYMSWLFSYDAENLFKQSSDYKKITVACPVDLYVYDSNDNLVSSIINNEIKKSILNAEILNDVKEVYLPSDEDFTLRIVATDDGTVNYSITECLADGTEVRKINSYDIPISDGLELNGEICGEFNIDFQEYKLIDSNGKIIYADEDLSEEELFNININVSLRGKGYVLSEGKVSKGSYTTIKAIADEGYLFYGWYDENGEIAIKENEISFIAKQDVNLIARFRKEGLGDIDKNQKINSFDALKILQLSSSENITEEEKELADINEDGKVNSLDALKVLQYATRKIDTLE